MYPIPERTVVRTFDEDNQPVIKTGSVSEVNTGYEFPFTVEKLDELHKWCVDKVTATKTKKTQYICQKLNEYKISIQSWKDFRNGDFETLYATGSADGTIKPVVRAKTKKSKEQEQSDFQKEILKKPYTTNVKPKEEEIIKYDEPIVQGTVTASTASQQRE